MRLRIALETIAGWVILLTCICTLVFSLIVGGAMIIKLITPSETQSGKK